MAAKKTAIQARQGHPTGIIDDIGKAIGKAIKKNSPRTVYGNVNRAVRTKVLPKSLSGDKAYIGKRFNISEKNYNPNAFPKSKPLTKKEFKQTSAYLENTKKAAKTRAKRNIK